MKGNLLITKFGEKLISPYKITRNIGVVHYHFYKVSDTDNNITLRLGSGISNFSMLYSSGNEYISGTTDGIQDVRFPLHLKITYTVWNKVHTSQNSIVFEFVINEPGKWEVTIGN